MNRFLYDDAVRRRLADAACLVSLAGVGAWMMLSRLGKGTLGVADEGIYASVAWGVLRSGDFFNLSFLGAYWAEKPPLWIWILALSLASLGGSVLAIQLPSALAGAALPCVTYGCGRSWFGRPTAWLAGLLAVTFPVVVDFGRCGMIDVPLLLLYVLAIGAAYRAGDDERRWIACGACLGLAVLLKGAAGAVIAVAIAAAWLIERRPSPLRSRAFQWGLGIAFLIVAPWYAQQTLAHGAGFLKSHFGAHLLDRVGFAQGDSLGEGYDPAGLGDWFYLALLFGPRRAVSAWGGVAALAFAALLLPPAADVERRGARVWTLAWFLVPLWLVWGMRFKNSYYVIPFLVPYALVLAGFLVRLVRERGLPWDLLLVLAFGAFNMRLAQPLCFLTRSGFFDGALLGISVLALRAVLARTAGERISRQVHTALVSVAVAAAVLISVEPPRVADRFPGLESLQAAARRAATPETRLLMADAGIGGEIFLYPLGFEWAPDAATVYRRLAEAEPILAALSYDAAAGLAQARETAGRRLPVLARAATFFDDTLVLVTNRPEGRPDHCLYLPAGEAAAGIPPFVAVRALGDLPPGSGAPPVELGGFLRLRGLAVAPLAARRGEWLEVRLEWECTGTAREGLRRELLLVPAGGGAAVAATAGGLLHGDLPSASLRPGWVVVETERLRVPFDCAHGAYRLLLRSTPELPLTNRETGECGTELILAGIDVVPAHGSRPQ